MKNSALRFAGIVMIAVLFCCSCQKERFVEELERVDDTHSHDYVKTICFSVDPFVAEDGDISTKSTYDANGNFYFASTDTVGIFPAKGAQVYFEIEGDDIGKPTVRFDGGGWALKEGISYWSYFPMVGDFYLKKNNIPVKYMDLTQNGNESLNHISLVDFLYTDECTVQNGSLSFIYHRLNCILRPRVTLPAGTYSKIVIHADEEVFISKGHYDLTADSPSIIGSDFTDHLTLNLENASFSEETAFVGNLMTAPVDISNMPIKVIIYCGDSPRYYYTYERTSPLKANTPYGLRCTDLIAYVNDAASANEAFANGFKSIEFVTVPSEDIDLFLPQTTEDVSINFPDADGDIKVSVSYPDGATSKPEAIFIKGPEDSDISLNTPNSTVTIQSGNYDVVESITAPNTLVLLEEVSVHTLNLIQGSVVVNGHVDIFNCEDMEDSNVSTVTVNGTVDSFLGEEDVTIITQPTALSLDFASVEVNAGESVELHPSWIPSYASNVELEWSSSDNTVASVSSTGVVQGLSAGTATITVSLAGNSSIFATCSVTVIAASQNNIIYYTSSDGNIVTPYATNVFGANIVSNNYDDGLGVIIFDGDVTSIGESAFNGCKSLSTITLPESVSSIGLYAFAECLSLSQFSGKFAADNGRCLIVDDILVAVATSGITSYSIPDGVKEISCAFNYTNISSVTIPASVTTIGSGAFQICKNLHSIEIPNSVTTIGYDSFSASGLTSITIPASVTTIGATAFDTCLSLETVTIEGAMSIGERAFNNCPSLSTITLPESLRTIGYGAFQSCRALTSLIIPSSVSSLDNYAFYGCKGLSSITFKSTTPPTVYSSSGIFQDTNNCPIYVPAESVGAYRSASGWTSYASRIQASPSSNDYNGHAYVDMGNGLK